MATVKSTSVNSLMSKAQQALSRNHWFEAERLCARGLDMARSEGDFNLMARIVLPLQEARRQRMQAAFDSRKISIIDEATSEERQLETRCYLVQPPLVGADARRIRLLALEREVPAMVLCREPKTQLGLCPIVAIGQVTVRTRIDPARNMRRFYMLTVQPDLFGGASLIREWGRIGSRGQSLIEHHSDEGLAITALLKRAATKRKRGYTI